LHKPIWPLKLCNDSSLPHGHWKSNINQGNLLLSPPCLNPHSIFSIYHQFLWVVRSSKYLRFAPDQHAEWQFTKLLIKTPGDCVCVRHAVVPKIMARHYDINNFHIPAHNKSYGVWSLSEPSSPPSSTSQSAPTSVFVSTQEPLKFMSFVIFEFYTSFRSSSLLELQFASVLHRTPPPPGFYRSLITALPKSHTHYN